MTLKEKFHQWLRTEPYSLKDAVTLREAQCEVIADEFAIGFADWFHENCYEDQVGYYTASELLETYKKEKGL